jgi:transglutaminase-like putative cysteine protease
MKYKLIHKTQYRYFEKVNNYHSLVCLQPQTMVGQICKSFSLEISPKPADITQRKDFFGNTVHYFSIHIPHQELQVLATSEIESFPKKIPFYRDSISVEQAREIIWNTRALKIELLQYILPSPFINWDDEITLFAKSCFPENRPLYEGVANLCHKIFSEFKFVSNYTSIYTPIKTVLRERKGVCQDFSHLAIACLRSLGLPARYVSGYIETLPPPGKAKLQGTDASHAWISVYIPQLGWCEFDPTNDMVPQERHIITAYGRDYSDVAPLKGVIFSSGRHTLSVSVDVLPVA